MVTDWIMSHGTARLIESGRSIWSPTSRDLPWMTKLAWLKSGGTTSRSTEFPRNLMIRLTAIPILPVLFAAVLSYAQTSPARPPLRVGIVGLVHGHVHGFLDQSRHSPEIEIVGIAEPTRQACRGRGSVGRDRQSRRPRRP